MKKLLSVLAVLLLLASPAYGQKTKSGMTTEINTNLPDNTINEITPGILRSTLIDMVNSWYGLVDATNSGTGQVTASGFALLTAPASNVLTGSGTYTALSSTDQNEFIFLGTQAVDPSILFRATNFIWENQAGLNRVTLTTTTSPTLSIGVPGSSLGVLALSGNTSGTVQIVPQATAGAYNFNLPTTSGTAGQVLTSQGGVSNAMTWTGPLFSGAVTSASAGNPTGTTSTSGVMQGDGSVCHITPTQSSRVFVTFTGNISNTTASDAALAAIRVGTGTAPVNGAAATGSAVGGNMLITNNANTAGMSVSVTSIGIATGLTLNTAYWFDILQEAITGGTATFQNVTCTIAEF